MQTRTEQANVRPYTPGPHEKMPRPAVRRRPPAARAALVHGAYLMATGAWPIVHLQSFAWVTGPKPEGWLAKAVGACMLNIGTTLAAAGVRGKVSRELRILGIGTALTFAGMDFYYSVIRRRIKPTYLFNAAGQLLCAALWGLATAREAREIASPPEAAFA